MVNTIKINPSNRPGWFDVIILSLVGRGGEEITTPIRKSECQVFTALCFRGQRQAINLKACWLSLDALISYKGYHNLPAAVSPAHTDKAQSVLEALSQGISVFGLPEIIRSDQGSKLNSRLFAPSATPH